MSKSALTPCECSKFSAFVNFRTGIDGDPIWDEELTTGCGGRLTKRTFAPGHDAKLKGFLIRVGASGHEVTDDQGITCTAEAMAGRYGFAHMVRQGVENAKLARQDKADRARARARKSEARADADLVRLERELAEAEEAAVVVEPEVVKAKVGRWTYDGTVDTSSEVWTFTYADAKGVVKVATKFALV